MGRPRWWVASVASVALAMIASACGSGGSEPAGDSGGAPSNSDATVSIYGTEPENTLLPANTNEAGGSKAAEALYVGLVGFRPDDGATFNAVAESITSSDAKVYDITIKKGWKFHASTKFLALTSVPSWNFQPFLMVMS